MPNLWNKILLLLLLSIGFYAKATHLVGGYFEYQCLGITPSNQVEYEITLYLYVDCGPTANPITEDARFAVFDDSNVEVIFDSLQRSVTNRIPDTISNPCVGESPTVCVDEQIYTGTIILDRNREHTITYQRCCLNLNIDNIVIDPIANAGYTITTTIPEFDDEGCNNTPEFNTFPPILICAGFDIDLDLSVADSDTLDSLVYSLCAPFDYADQNNFRPNPINPPPYDELIFTTGRSASDPIPSSPQISIDAETGRLTGVPTELGQYVVGFCVEEYRNGRLINITRRSIQVTSQFCNPVIISTVQSQQQFCDGFRVQFGNNSTSNNGRILGYRWDFGVAGTDSDTSREVEPEFTFPGEGFYTVTLIANPDLPCPDTSTEVFEVLPLLEPAIDIGGQLCIDNNFVDFDAAGDFEPDATFSWDFGTAASLATSTEESEDSIIFTVPGSNFPVSLTVSQDNCTETVDTTFSLIDNPIASFTLSDSAGCAPLTVNFTNTSNNVGATNYDWTFGDGGTSTDENPTHIYLENGEYDVRFELRTTEGCIDTAVAFLPNAVDVSLDSATNEIDFQFSPTEGCLPLTIQFTNNSTFDGTPTYIWDFQNGDISFEESPTTVFSDTGTFSVSLLMINEGKCADTLVQLLEDTITVFPLPTSSFTVSDTAKEFKQALFEFDGSASQFASRSVYLINGVEVDTNSIFNFQFRDTGRHVIDYVVFNEFGCSDTSSAEVFVFDEFEFIIPNVFTPNEDGLNDNFAMRSCGVYEYEIMIFNRYGDKVFESNSLNINWDGRISGRAAKSGVYFYSIRIKDFRGQFLDYQGNVTLISD